MRRIKDYSLLLCVMTLCVCSCTKDGPAPVLTLDHPQDKSISFDYKMDSRSIKFSSNVAWTASVENADVNSWCIISPKSGDAGNCKISVSVINNTSPDGRSANVLIAFGDSIKKISVYQEQAPFFSVSSDLFNVPETGSTLGIGVQTNQEYSIRISDNDSKWIHQLQNQNGTRAVVESVVYFTIDPSQEYDSREGTIEFISNENTQVVRIIQKQMDVLTVSENQFDLPVSGGNIQFDVMTNMDYSINISDDCKEWIHPEDLPATRSIATTTHSFNIDSSLEYNSREGRIEIVSGDKKEYVTITQKGEPILSVSQKEFNLSNQEHEISIEVLSNFEYAVDIPKVDWISEASSSTRSVISSRINLLVSKNDSYDGRAAVVRIYDRNSSIFEEIAINQSPINVLELDCSDFEFDENGGTFTVNIQSNINYQISIGDDWIQESTSQSSTRAIVASSHTFTVKELSDATSTSRSTKITFFNEVSGISEDLTVTQTNMFYLDRLSLSMAEGESASLSLTNLTGQNVTWSSSNSSVVTVDQSGNLKGVERGTATVTVSTADNKHSRSCEITVKDIRDYISASNGGGATIEINGLLYNGSKLNWYFYNRSSMSVTLVSLQLIDGATGNAGNEMGVNVEVGAGNSVGYTTTIGAAGIHLPVTCRFKYTCNGNTYTTDAVYKGYSY